jgi:hypothetical protein
MQFNCKAVCLIFAGDQTSAREISVCPKGHTFVIGPSILGAETTSLILPKRSGVVRYGRLQRA